MQRESQGYIFGLLAAVAGPCMAVFTKLSVGVPVETLVFCRFAIGYPIFIWFMHKNNIHISWRKMPKHFLRAISGLAALYCYFYAIQMIPLVNAVTLSNTKPLFMPFIALIWMKVLVSLKRFIAAVIGFTGVVVLIQPSMMSLELGGILGLLGGFLGAIAMMGIRQLSKTESSETILSYYFVINTIVSFLPFAITFQTNLDLRQLFSLMMVGFFALIYQYALTKAYTHAPATKISTLNYLNVALGGLAGWLVFDEVPGGWVIAGISLIVFGTLLSIFDKSKPRSLI